MVNKEYKGFEWDNGNVWHLGDHGFTPQEIEALFTEKVVVRVTRDGRRIALGQTIGGRYLKVIYEKKENGIIRVITAYDMKPAEKRHYKSKKGV